MTRHSLSVAPDSNPRQHFRSGPRHLKVVAVKESLKPYLDESTGERFVDAPCPTPAHLVYLPEE